ncbi:MAG: DUF1007 family protein [Deltaproteobacteria bacterium]|nr:DUF1007 family protein [Deltaproteobacteria bacterium]
MKHLRMRIIGAVQPLYPAIVVILLLGSGSSAFAHPHVFIENRLAVVFDSEGLAGIEATWVFDEFFSNMIAVDYDRNQNGKLEPGEVATVKEKAFDNLINFDYFTFIRINGRPFKVQYIRDFSAILSDGRLIYRFMIPCHVKGGASFKEITIAQYDPSYYTAIAFPKDRPIGFQGEEDFEIHYDIAANREEAYYYDQIHPVEVRMRFRQKDG